MIDKTLRRIKRLGKIGIHVPVSQADLAELEAERDRLRQLRGYGKKETTGSNDPKEDAWIADLLENWDKPRGLAIRAWLKEQLLRVKERGYQPRNR